MKKNLLLREKILLTARSWLETRFHYQARIKKSLYDKGGCDCLGLIIGVARELSLPSRQKDSLGRNIPLHEFDRKDYGTVLNKYDLHSLLCELLYSKTISDIDIGDLLLFKINDITQHLAILGKQDKQYSMIHCLISTRKVVEHRLDDFWYKKLVAVFSVLP